MQVLGTILIIEGELLNHLQSLSPAPPPSWWQGWTWSKILKKIVANTEKKKKVWKNEKLVCFDRGCHARFNNKEELERLVRLAGPA